MQRNNEDNRDAMLRDAIAKAVQDGIKGGVGAVAEAMRSAVPAQPATVNVRQRQHNPLAIAAMVVGMIVPFGGGFGWVMSLSSRLSVAESRLTTVENKQTTIDSSMGQIAALKQEVTDFRGEFRDWKRDNSQKDSPSNGK